MKVPSIRRVPSLVALVAFLVVALPGAASAFLPTPGKDGNDYPFPQGNRISVKSDRDVGNADTGPPRQAPRIPNHYIVVFKDSVAGPKTVALAQTEQQDGDLGFVYSHAIKGYSAELTKDAVEALRRNPKVDYVVPDREVEATAQTIPTGITRISADKNPVLDIDETDDIRVNADVAVIDTGIDYTHPDLNVVARTNCVPPNEDPAGAEWNVKACVDNTGVDGSGHGTHVAGTIGAIDNGIGVVGAAPGARLWAVRVLNNKGYGSQSWVLAGIDWVTAHAGEIEVANMSLAGAGRSPAYDSAITASVNAGVVYVVAAGNSAQNAEGETPANSPDVITVSALGACCSGANDRLASFSNWGSTVEIVAPGTGINSTLPIAGSAEGKNYGTLSGTSMASPHVAGAAAVLAAKSNPNSRADVETIKKTLIDEASLEWNDSGEDGKPEPLLYMGIAPITTAQAETGGWTALNATNVSMFGAFNTRGLSTQYRFEYGPTPSYGSTTSWVSAAGSLKYTKVNRTVGSLQQDQPYHYRLAISTSQGTVYGRDRVFAPSLWTYAPAEEALLEYEELTDISCPSASFCISTGWGYQLDNYAIAYTFVGGQWNYSGKLPTPEGEGFPLANSIDCTAVNACTAVGKVQISGGRVVPLVDRWNGTSWSIQSVPEPPSEATVRYAQLEDVSCVSASECLAVGYYKQADVDPNEPTQPKWRAFSTLWKNGQWTNTYPLPEGGFLEGVSCASSTFCGGVGSGAKALNWNGSAWVQQPSEIHYSFDKVSCPSVNFCMGVGVGRNRLAVWNGSKWSEQLLGNENRLADVSCSSSTDCMVGGLMEEKVSHRVVPSVEMWNGSSLTPQGTLRNSEESRYFWGLDCVSTGFCAAVASPNGGIRRSLLATTSDWRPTVGKASATDIKFDSATFRAGINPNKLNTSYVIEYGPTTAYGSKIPANGSEAIGSGSAEVQVAQSVSGLKPDTTYHFRVVATSAGGARSGVDQELRTVLPGRPTFSKDLGSLGTGEGQLSEPRGVAVDAQGNLHVADLGNHRVEKLDPDGKYLAQIKHDSDGHPSLSPWDVAIGGNGDIYVGSTATWRVEKFNSTGQFLAEYNISPSTPARPESIALDSSGNMYIAGSSTPGDGSVAKLSPSGETLAVFGISGEGDLTNPGGIVFGPEGNLYVSDSDGDRVAKFEPGGKYLGQIGSSGSAPGKLDNPRGLDIGPEGNLYVTDTNNHRVEIFKLGGEYVTQFGFQGQGAGAMLAPVGIAFGAKGEIYVTDNEGDQVHKWLLPTSSLPYAVVQPTVWGPGGAATLKAQVYPSGLPTTYKFEYGTTTSYGTSVPVPAQSIGSGYEAVEVSQGISGLSPGTTYHFRIVAQNSAGTFTAADQEFTTKAVPTNTVLPVISPATPFEALSASTTNGTWTGTPTVYAYQWKRCNGSGGECVNIAKLAKAATYKPTPTDAEPTHTLRVEVTAYNEQWSASATSQASNVVKPLGEVNEFSLPAGSEARGITSSPDGNLWFADFPVGKIGKITTTGTITEYALAAGSKPWALTVGPKNKLWYTSNDSIGVMSASGTVEATYGLPAGSSPRGITVGPDGNFWFCNYGTNKIGKITPTGVKTEYPVTGAKPVAITAGPDGNLWFVTEVGNTVGKITTAGAVTEYSLGAGSQPVAIAKGPDENLWVAQPGIDRIAKVTTAGTVTQYTLLYTLFENSNPSGIVAGADGNLWFTLEGQVGKITTNGPKEYFPLLSPGGANKIALGSDNRLWFTRSNGKIGAVVP